MPTAIQPPTPSERVLRKSAVAGAILCLLWVAGLVWFVIPPPIESRKPPTDAIVVLTGGSSRLEGGIDLMREGKGRQLFVSGVNQQVDLDELLRASGDAPRRFSCCIVVGHEAENTDGNARETAHWMRQQGYHSLRLVTAWYHMPRSLIEFERAMPEMEIVPHPVFPQLVKPHQQWLAWRGAAALLVGEYAKYLAAILRSFVEKPLLAGLEPVEAEPRE